MVIFRRHPAVPFFLLIALSSNVLGFAALAPAATADQLQPGSWSGSWRRHWRPRSVFGGGAYGAFGRISCRRRTVVAGAGPRRRPSCARARPDRAVHAARGARSGFLVDAPATEHDTLNEFERWCRHPAQVALLLFGLVTGGVLFRALDDGTLALPAAVLIGKPLGLLAGVASRAPWAFTCPSTSAGASSSSWDSWHDWLHDGALLCHRVGRTRRGAVRAQDGCAADARRRTAGAGCSLDASCRAIYLSPRQVATATPADDRRSLRDVHFVKSAGQPRTSGVPRDRRRC